MPPLRDYCPIHASGQLIGGGSGYRTGIRGGGPLTTLVLGKSLWETCWFNVLVRSNYQKKKIVKAADSDRFPWLAKTRTSEKDTGCAIYPDDVHPDQQYWAMPCRVHLTDPQKSGRCDVCGEDRLPTYSKYMTKNHGVNYQGQFEHPLSPHFEKTDGLVAFHAQPGGIAYKYWLGLVSNTKEGGNASRPARVVQQFVTMARDDSRLWAFGYDFTPGQANARCWYDGAMPILFIEPKHHSVFGEDVAKMISAARYVSGLVLSAALKATIMEPEREDKSTGKIIWRWPKEMRKAFKIRADAPPEDLEDRSEKNPVSFTSSIRSKFWNSTEAPFFQHLYRLRENLIRNADEKEALESWRSNLRNEALQIFDTYSQTGDFDAADPRRVALAGIELSKALSGKLMYDKLGLPWPKNSNMVQP